MDGFNAIGDVESRKRKLDACFDSGRVAAPPLWLKAVENESPVHAKAFGRVFHFDEFWVPYP